ncbi:MAG: hypothetical protein KF740_11265 [Ramlibacter sp.]|nr:hypothetical protein [Ramlibacter sp.]
MDDSSQIEIPPSFFALFTSPAGRLNAPMTVVCERYELCEDLAHMLVEQAAALAFKVPGGQEAALAALHAGLTGPDAPVDAAEASWVVSRLAELLGGG